MTGHHSSRMERLAAIEQLLVDSTAGLRAVEIAQRCKVDRRTIYRDLMRLSNGGVPIYQKDGRFFLDRTRHSAAIRLTFGEALALMLAGRATRYNAPHNPYLASALHKLASALPETLTAYVEQSVGMLNEAVPDPEFADALEAVAQAWAERKHVRLLYMGRDHRLRSCEFAVYTIDQTPMGVVYVVGLDVTARRMRTIKLHRIKHVRPLAETYLIPPHFDPARYTAR